MTTPHSATGYSNPAQSSPAETYNKNGQDVNNLRAQYDRSADSSKEQYQLLTGLQVGPDPEITAFLPPNGWVTATPVEFTLTVVGENFQDGSVVTVNGVEFETTFVDTENLTIELDTLDEADTVDVVVINGSRSRSAESSFAFLEIPVPTITSLDPDTAEEGTGPITVTINGTDFLPSAEVYWDGGGTPLATTSVLSATQIEVEVPDETDGGYDVVVDNGESKVSTAAVFTYTAAG